MQTDLKSGAAPMLVSQWLDTTVPFTIMHTSGAMDRDPPESALEALLDELSSADVEHPDVTVSDESGWTLSAFHSGRVVWENVEEDGEVRHLKGVDRERLVAMFVALSRGDLASIEANPWIPGY